MKRRKFARFAKRREWKSEFEDGKLCIEKSLNAAFVLFVNGFVCSRSRLSILFLDCSDLVLFYLSSNEMIEFSAWSAFSSACRCLRMNNFSKILLRKVRIESVLSAEGMYLSRIFSKCRPPSTSSWIS